MDVAKEWSEAGESRVLITTRMANLECPDYCYLPLAGLDREDALAYFQALAKLPPEPEIPLPERETLLDLFQQVDFHPLSIGLLAQQLKFRVIEELGERLRKLLQDKPDNVLLASLNLSLERLSPEAQQWLPRLGVFQGGAMEGELVAITKIDAQKWTGLRKELATTGLIQIEHIPGVVPPYFLKFHPTLAPVLWSRLTEAEQAVLSAGHRQRYYVLSSRLYDVDQQHPHEARAVAQRELPNLLHAVDGALQAGEEWAVEFITKVNQFLDYFGLQRERATLIHRAEQATGAGGSHNWYMACTNRGQQLFSAGRYQEAEQVFTEMLQVLGDEPSYQRLITLNLLGRCLRFQGQAARAEALYRQGLAVVNQLEPSQLVKQQRGFLQTELADILRDQGDYQQARAAYEAALDIAKEQGNDRQVSLIEGQLGSLALRQGNLQEAEKCYCKALATFQRLKEPVAVYWFQLGRVYQETRRWEKAEQAYREAARIHESQGNLASAAQTWCQLAIITQSTRKFQEAEKWYRKAIAGMEKAGDWLSLSTAYSNLAVLLQNQPDRLAEAQQLAEQALAICQTLDSAAAKIWITYGILAEIADQEGDADQARSYRRRERELYAGFAGAWYRLRQFAPLMAEVVAVAADPAQRNELEATLEKWAEAGGGNLVAAIRRILDGERDEEAICEGLNYESWMIVHAILRGIAEPGSLEALLADQPQQR